MKKLLIAIACIAACGSSFADTSDRSQPIRVTANQLNGDEVQQTAIYSGSVRVVQGTMEITGERLVLSEDAAGYRKAVMTAAKGQLVHFKQRRDPKQPDVEEWITGEGERLEYNERDDKVILTSQAKLHRLENGVKKDETIGQRVIYDMRNSTSSVEAAKNGGRVSTVLAPRNTDKDGKKDGKKDAKKDKKDGKKDGKKPEKTRAILGTSSKVGQ